MLRGLVHTSLSCVFDNRDPIICIRSESDKPVRELLDLSTSRVSSINSVFVCASKEANHSVFDMIASCSEIGVTCLTLAELPSILFSTQEPRYRIPCAQKAGILGMP